MQLFEAYLKTSGIDIPQHFLKVQQINQKTPGIKSNPRKNLKENWILDDTSENIRRSRQ